jgi:hypothetical protein
MKTLPAIRKFAILLLSFGILILNSCQKDEFPDPGLLPKGLAGSWVEVHTLADTISFISNSDTGIFILQKGFEIRNGYLLPTIGSTGYTYAIFENNIKLKDVSSSFWKESSYYFQFDEKNLILKIGKFSNYIEVNKSILTFRKIK